MRRVMALYVPVLTLTTLVAWATEPGTPVEGNPNTTVAVQVTVEQKGKAVVGLTAGNFRVYEDGEPRGVIRAEPADPASIVLLVENSLHSWRFLNDVRSAMRGFLRAADEQKGHSYALVTYERKPIVEQTLTQEISRIRAAFVDVKQSAWGRTDTYDSIYRVLEEMESLPGRRVLIFLGFGYDAFSRHTFGELQRKVHASNIQVYAIATGSDLRQLSEKAVGTPPPADQWQGDMLIRMLAEQSGGKWFCPSCEAGYADSMREIMDTLDHQYTVEYRRPEPPAPGFHKLRIQAFEITNDTRRDFKVRARPGWQIGAAAH